MLTIRDIRRIRTQRLIAAILVFSFLSSPLSFVFAVASTTASSIHPGTATGEGTLGGGSLLDVGGGEGNLDVSRNVYDSGRYSEIDQLFGTYNFEVPIVVPPGRNGIQPQLSLRYNSRPQYETSVVGYGWSLSIPFIERINKRGTDRMFSDTDFYATLSGELASTSGTTYKTKVENGDFMTYEFSDNTWTAKDKQGTIYKFGFSTSSRQDHPSNSATTSKWMLEEIRDRNDNYETFSYYKNGGQIYPSFITYTHSSTSADGIFEIDFHRESRSDIATSSAVGFPVVTNERIAEIITKINGTWARKYKLQYTNPANRKKSLLSSVTEYGRADDGSTTTRPAYQFSYQESDQKEWSTDLGWNPPVFFAKSTGVSLGTLIADINGDGRPDLLHSLYNTGVNEKSIFLNTGTTTGKGWATSTSWTYPWGPYFTSNDVTNPFFPTDLNADGYDDFIYNGTSSLDRNVYINTKSGWATSTTDWSLPTSFENATRTINVRILDVNDDQLPDILKADENGNIKEAYVNTGGGWATSTVWLTPQYFVSGSSDLGVVFAELNGDGLPDLVRSYKNTAPNPDEVINIAYLNTGSGWATSTQWTHPNTTQVVEDNVEKEFRFVEINGDGTTDIIHGSPLATYVNAGTSWLDITSSWPFPSSLATPTGLDNGSRLLDLDADTLVDFMVSRQGVAEADAKRVDFNMSKVVDTLSQIVFPQGGTTTIEYKSSHEYRNGTTPLNNNLPYPFLTVATTTDRDGQGNMSVTSYSYEGGKMYWNSAYDRKFAGFNSVTKTDAEGNVTKTYFHQASTTESSLGEYDDHVSKIGKAYRVEQYDNANNLYSVVINKWDKDDLGNGRYFVKLAERLSLNYDGDTDHKDTLETFSYASGTGNVAEKINWGKVMGSTTGTYSDTGSDKFIVAYTYATSTTYNIYGLPSDETVNDQSGNKVRESRFYYDSGSLGSVTKGNLTKQEMRVSGSTYIDTEKTYNSYGLVTTEKDPKDQTTSYTYDTYNLYPATTTNPLSQTVGRVYDYSSGKVRTVTDQNSRVFETMFDGFDRVLNEKQPDLTSPSTLVTKTDYTYTDTGYPTRIQKTDYLNSATSTDAYSYFDGFGRKIEDRVEAEGTNTYAVKEVVYNKLGLVARESLPYFASSTAYTGVSAPPSNALFISYTYDPLQRVKTVANIVGTTTNTYDDWVATTTDPLGNYKCYTKDAYGNLVTVQERNSTSTYTTSYEYDGNNKLTKITDAEGNIRNFTYDGLGRRLTAQDLHDAGDGTYGTWTFVYDDAGNIATTIDPKSQTVEYTYDSLNRVLTENFTGGAGTEVSYAYDTCADGKGRLCAATTADAVTQLSYNALGLASSETKILNSVPYVTSYTYDRLGNKTLITYPGNSSAQYLFNSAGQLNAVLYLSPGGTVMNIVTNFDYGPHGSVTIQADGNGATTTRVYDANELYRLRSIITTATSSIGTGGGGDVLRFLETMLGLSNYTFAFDEVSSSSVSEEVPATNSIPEITDDTVINVSVEPRIETTPPEVVNETPINSEIPNADLGEMVTQPTTTEEVVAESTPFIPVGTTTIRDTAKARITLSLEGKGDAERAQIKAHELSQIVFNKVFDDSQSGIRTEVIGISEIPEGVQVFAKGWKNEKQLGFGRDGSVEIERFLIHNPPILVPDPSGDIVQKSTDVITGEEIIRTLREDPEEAIMQAIAHTMSVKKEAFTDSNIAIGKVGNTTSMFYPDPHPETTTVDGYTLRSSTNSTWANMRGGAGTGSSDNAVNIPIAYLVSGSSSGWNQMYRSFFLFNTASIPDTDAISGATLSLYGQSKFNATGNGMEAYIVSSNPSSNTAIASGDHTTVGSTRLSDTDIAYASFSTTTYNTYTLNASGISNISKTGISKFGTRGKADFSNAEPADRLPNASDDGLQVWESDKTGTSQDPVLIVEHSDPSAPKPPKDIQKLTYTYDAVGNITQIANSSQTLAFATTTYQYDPLYRLITASTTIASSTPYKHSFAYSPMGNITAMSTTTSTTTYTYAETGYTNPQAPTTMGGMTLTYDTNGNLTAKGNTAYTWDYRNRMTATAQGGATTTYAYDHTYERVKKVATSSTTYYPNDLYSKEGATSTMYIYGNGVLLATVEGNGVSTSTQYYHQDHLGGTSAVTDALGTLTKAMDYYPYGGQRISTGNFTAMRTFIGEMYDEESDLSYLKARYLDSKRGQFLSQDPVFWEIAQSPDGIAVLRNPQAQNSYSYGQNNPIVNKDPDGRIAILAPILIGGGVGMLGGIGGQLISDYNSGEWSDLSTYGTAAVSGATVGVGVTIAGMTGGVLLVAGTAGGLTAGMQMASDAYLGKQTDYRDVITNSILSAGTAGVLKGVPAMKGRWPGLSSSALVVGRHTQRQAAEEAFSSGLQAVRQSVGTFISSSQSSSRSSGSSNNSSYVKQLKSIVTQLQSIVSKLKSLKK